MTTEIFNDAIEIQGNQDAVQLRVQGHSQQTDPLQTWEDHAGTSLAHVTSDGRLEIGDLTVGAPDALLEVNNNLTLPTSEPLQGIQSHGRVSGVISNAIAWMVSELELLGSGGISGLHTALRGKLFHNNTGDVSNAELRAGDFEVVNQSGTVSLPVGQVTGLQSAITNQEDAHIDEAVGVGIRINDEGSIQNAYGLRVEDINQGAENYAIYTGDGPVHLGDYLELEPPTGAVTKPTGGVRLYPKPDGKLYLYSSVDEQEHEVGSGASALSDLTDIGSAAPTLGHMLRADGDSWESINPADYVFIKQADGSIDINTIGGANAIDITGGGIRADANHAIELNFTSYDNASFGVLGLYRALGTKDSPLAVIQRSGLGAIAFMGYTGTNWDYGAYIQAYVTAVPGEHTAFASDLVLSAGGGGSIVIHDNSSIEVSGPVTIQEHNGWTPSTPPTSQRGLFPKADGWHDIDDTGSRARLAFASEIQSVVPTGCMMIWPTNTPPSGWLLCAGQLLSMTGYKTLLDVILADITVANLGLDSGTSCTTDNTTDAFTSTAHGMTDGTVVMFSATTLPSGLDGTARYFVINSTPNTFRISMTQNGSAVNFTSDGTGVKFHQQFNNLDLRGRFPLGQDDMGGTDANRVTAVAAASIGDSSGAETHTLAIAEMPSHGHNHRHLLGNLDGPNYGLNSITIGANMANHSTTPQYTQYSNPLQGNGNAHNNMPPYLTLNYIIKA